MTQPVRTSALQRNHATLWYDFASYRLAWLVLPQAFIALVFAVFLLGGNLADGFLGGLFGGWTETTEPTKGEWGKPMDLTEVGAELDLLRDAVAQKNDADSLAVLEGLAANGNAIAAFKLAELYDPLQAGMYPNPAQKDAKRALALFQPAADDGILSAMAAISVLRLAPDTPSYDAALGCEMVQSFVTKLLDRVEKPLEDDAWYLIQAADCMTGLILPEGGQAPTLTKESAEQAIALYHHPLVAKFSDAPKGLANLYLTYGSPVYDIPKGCEFARDWIERAGVAPEALNSIPGAFLIEVGYCLIGVDGYRKTPDYGPTLADEKTTYSLWSLPSLADNIAVIRNLAWFDLNASNQTANIARGCDTAQHWADLAGDDQAEFDLLNDWLGVRLSKCLIGRFDNTGTTPLTAKQREIGLALLEHKAAAKTYPLAMVELGFVYEGGAEGVAVDMNRARTLYQDCATIGGLADCNANIGRFKKYGLGGLAIDLEAAAADFTLCADAGIYECHAQLVDTWEQLASPRMKNVSAVLSHLEQAADGGDTFGLWLYGLAIYNGDYGLQADKEAAALWLIKAVDASFDMSYVNSLKNTIGPQIKSKPFWISFHTELQRRAVYEGKIYDRPTEDGFAALAKLVD